MKSADRIRLVPTASEVARFNTWFDDNCARSGVPQSLRADLKLCINEVLANLISYGLNGITQPWVLIEINLEPHRVSAAISDNGTPFDICRHSTAMPDPGTVEPGGYGIALIKERATTLQYHRVDGQNRLVIVCETPNL